MIYTKQMLLIFVTQIVIVIFVLCAFSVVRFGYHRYKMMQTKETLDSQHAAYNAAIEKMVSKLSTESIDKSALLGLKQDMIETEQSIDDIENGTYSIDAQTKESIYTLQNSLWSILRAIEHGEDNRDAFEHMNETIEVYNAHREKFACDFGNTFWSLKDYTF